MNFQRIILSVFAILVMVAGTLWFVKTFELKETQEYVGLRGEAQYNNLFAARLFLKSMGIPAERKDTLTTLPPQHSVLILNTERYTLSQHKINEILSWVKAGGHLITRARSSVAESLFDTGDEAAKPAKYDPLQAALGISLGKHIMPDDADLPTSARLANMPSDLTLKVNPSFFDTLVVDKTAYTQQFQGANWLLEKPFGNGKITLLANLELIENTDLNKYEHAQFFWYMVHSQHATPQSVWLVHQDDMPPLWKLLWQKAWALVLTLSLFVPLTLMALSPRFGALQPTPKPERRRILEHIRASGLFMWKRYTKQQDVRYQTFAFSVAQLFPTKAGPNNILKPTPNNSHNSTNQPSAENHD